MHFRRFFKKVIKIYIYTHLPRFLAKQSVSARGGCDTETSVTHAKHVNIPGCQLGLAITLSEPNTARSRLGVKLPDLSVAVLG
jgi:hypothetical protein